MAQCLHTESEAIQRLVRLIEQAEQRARAAGTAEDVRRDALASIETLVERIRQHAQDARRCTEAIRIPAPVETTVAEPAPTGPVHDLLAADRGTVHLVEANTRVATEVQVVRGERVDGVGRAPDESVRAAMRTIGGRLAQCYERYLQRGARRTFELHLSFTAEHGGRVSRATIEQGAPDATLRRCVARAFEGATIAGQQGRAVYAYVIRLGD